MATSNSPAFIFVGNEFSIGKRSSSGMYSSFHRRLVTLENVFDREIKSECIHHFREDWLLWRTFSIGKWRVIVFHHFREDWLCRTFSFGKWRVNVFQHTTWLAKRLRVPRQKNSSRSGKSGTLENIFDREMKSECIQSHEFQRRIHFREDWLVWRTVLIGKWRVNVFIISEKIGYSGERFRSGNEEWMYSNILRDLLKT